MSIRITGLRKVYNNLARVTLAVNRQSKSIPAECAFEYVQLVKQKIISQDFNFIPLRPAYAAWKKKHFPHARTFWHLSGDLHKAVQVIQIGAKEFAGTVPASIMDSGRKSYARNTSTSILKYAMALENGATWTQNGRTRKIPPRPLFWPTAVEYEVKQMPTHFDKALREIGKGWRK